MVLTKEELISSIQNEVRILLHLASKIDRAKLDYRPTPKQRSTIELLRYMTIMAPQVIQAVKNGAFDGPAFGAAAAKAEALDFDGVTAELQKQSGTCSELLSSISETGYRDEVEMFGRKASRGSHIVNIVLCGYAAYRTQLFCYLKACGREELNTMNLWAGMDAPMQAAS
jgi:hypothetical protein